MHPFDLRKEVGERPQALGTVKNKAIGAKITYNKPYYKGYNAGGDNGLIDGKCGGWTYSDGRWQGFLGTPAIDVVIDLGKTTSINNVEMSFMQMKRTEVFLPSKVQVMLSNDGQTYDEVYSKDEPQEDTENPLYRTHKWKGHKKARYVHVKVEKSTFGGFVMCDEIIIR